MDVIELAVNVIIIQILESEEIIFVRQQFLDVIELAVNVIIIQLLENEMKKQHFMDVIELAVNVIIIQILESEETTFYGCNRTSCKRYYNLDFRK